MALTTTVTVAGWFASHLISKLLDHHILNWKEKKELKKGLQKEVEGLRDVLPQLKSITEDAEEKQFKNEGVRGWLRKLKGVLYDAEDVLDLYEVDLLLKKQRDTEPPSKKKVSFPLSCLCRCKKSKDGAPSSSRISVAKEIKLIRKRLDEILKQGVDFGLKDMVRSAPEVDPGLFQKRETSSYPEDDESAILGRGVMKEEIIEQLVPDMERRVHPCDGEKRLSVLPIVGMGGLGKTTLAQLVFNDNKVVAYYKSRAWVCVGQSHNLDPSQTTAKIIESLRSLQGEKEACNFSTLSALQTTLVDEIKEPFLLVLDDAWDADRNVWNKLLGPLKVTQKRCRVIITTRDEKVANAFRDRVQVRRLDFLDNNCMWSIFEKSAFGSERATEFPRLETIGRQIVQRLKGLPLGAKTIGGILRGNRRERDWMKILNNEHLLNNNSREEDFMHSILMLSYYNLPVIVKQYFSCFSLFPKDHEFCRYAYRKKYNESVWMIERVLFLIEVGHDSKDMTYDCVNGLLSRSLLQASSNNWSVIKISMHDLVHDMAELLSKEEFLRISDAHKKKTIPEKIRHISFFQETFDKDSAILENLTRSKSLRTLLYNNTNERLSNPHGLLDGWFKNLRYLRVVTLYNNWITILPESIGNLKLLRYLDLFLPKIEKIPATISDLCKLKGLNLCGCINLRELPSSITRLINLIHLDVEPRLLKEVDGIGQFTNLQELEEFHVEEEKGHGIVELKNMNELCGSLSIYNLERVKNRENAQQAQLDQKKNLRRLELKWNYYVHEKTQTDIIEGLRPSTSLKELLILGYQGRCLPDWWASSSLISLHCLKVTSCTNLIKIPFLPSMLRSLELSGNTGVESLFSSPSRICMPSLHKLEVMRCGKLDESLNALLEASSSSLEYLTIHEYNCPLEGLSCVTTLRMLVLRDCKEKVMLNPTALISLRNMRIRRCPNMVVEGHCSDSDLCSSLTYLKIEKSHMLLKSLSQCRVILTSLTYLYMISCECDDSTLSKCLHTATALEELHLKSCSNLTSLPSALMHKLAAAKKLEIRSCRKLEEIEFPPVVNISIIIEDSPNLSFRRSSPIANTVIKRLEISGFGGEQLSGLFSISLNTPIQSIALNECIITDGTATSVLGGICRSTTLEELKISRFEGDSSEFSSLKILRRLEIRNSPAVTYLPILISLVSLRIVNCGNLSFTCGGASTPIFPSLEVLYADEVSMQHLNGLLGRLVKSPIKRITISHCIELDSFDGDLQSALMAFKNSLKVLRIRDCPNVRCLPHHLEVFESLCQLDIVNCPQMSTLPDGLPPKSLQRLVVRGSSPLEALYQNGNQWLSNIPRVKFQ